MLRDLHHWILFCLCKIQNLPHAKHVIPKYVASSLDCSTLDPDFFCADLISSVWSYPLYDLNYFCYFVPSSTHFSKHCCSCYVQPLWYSLCCGVIMCIYIQAVHRQFKLVHYIQTIWLMITLLLTWCGQRSLFGFVVLSHSLWFSFVAFYSSNYLFYPNVIAHETVYTCIYFCVYIYIYCNWNSLRLRTHINFVWTQECHLTCVSPLLIAVVSFSPVTHPSTNLMLDVVLCLMLMPAQYMWKSPISQALAKDI